MQKWRHKGYQSLYCKRVLQVLVWCFSMSWIPIAAVNHGVAKWFKTLSHSIRKLLLPAALISSSIFYSSHRVAASPRHMRCPSDTRSLVRHRNWAKPEGEAIPLHTFLYKFPFTRSPPHVSFFTFLRPMHKLNRLAMPGKLTLQTLDKANWTKFN